MEVGAGTLAVKRRLLIILWLATAVHLLPVDEPHWRVGIAETASARTDELPAADMLEHAIHTAAGAFTVRFLSDEESASLAQRIALEDLAASFREHHRKIAKRNDAFFSERTAAPVPEMPVKDVQPASGPVPLEIVHTGLALPFEAAGEAFLQAREHRCDMLLGSEIFTVSGVQYLHIYVYQRYSSSMRTIYAKPFDAVLLLDADEITRVLFPVLAGSQAGGMVVTSPVFTDLRINGTAMPMGRLAVLPPGKVRIEAGNQVLDAEVHPGEITRLAVTGTLPEKVPTLVRTLPPSAASPGLDQYDRPLMLSHTRPGYLPLYTAVHVGIQDRFIERELEPAWHQEVYSREMRGDQFYRSLAGFMLTLPAAAAAHGLRRELSGQETDIWDLLYYGTAAAVLTRAGIAIQSLVRYTK